MANRSTTLRGAVTNFIFLGEQISLTKYSATQNNGEAFLILKRITNSEEPHDELIQNIQDENAL